MEVDVRFGGYVWWRSDTMGVSVQRGDVHPRCVKIHENLLGVDSGKLQPSIANSYPTKFVRDRKEETWKVNTSRGRQPSQNSSVKNAVGLAMVLTTDALQLCIVTAVVNCVYNGTLPRCTVPTS